MPIEYARHSYNSFYEVQRYSVLVVIQTPVRSQPEASSLGLREILQSRTGSKSGCALVALFAYP
jgi:hypothetical protein